MPYYKPYEIRQSTSIVDYAISIGYKIIKAESTSKWPKLKNPSTGDTIIVNTKPSNSSDKELFLNVKDKRDKGDILEFAQTRLNNSVSLETTKKTFYDALTRLNNFKGNPVSDDINKANRFLKKKATMKSVALTEYNHKLMDDFTYLTDKRMISMNTLKNPAFKDRLFNTHYQLKNGHIMTNYGYGKFKEGSLVGMEVKNDSFNSLMGNTDAIFHTNPTKPHSSKIDLAFIGESTHDVMAHFELLMNNPNFEKNQNVVYLSTAGNIYDKKLTEISSTLDYLKCDNKTKFVSITDADGPGLNYDSVLMTFLIDKYLKPVVHEELEFHNKLSFNLSDLSNKEQEDLQDAVNTHNNEIDKKFSKEGNTPSFNDYTTIHKSAKDNSHIIFLNKNVTENASLIKDILKTFKGEHLFQTHKPKGVKDWNDKLIDIKTQKKKAIQSLNKENQIHKPKIRM